MCMSVHDSHVHVIGRVALVKQHAMRRRRVRSHAYNLEKFGRVAEKMHTGRNNELNRDTTG